MSSFITPIIAEFSAQLEAAAERVKANILREFEGLGRQSAASILAHEQARTAGTSVKALRKPVSAKGQKRSPEALALKVEEVFALIQRHPGQRIERLAEIAGLTTKEMVLPIKKLREAKRIATHGEKRATTYSVRPGK